MDAFLTPRIGAANTHTAATLCIQIQPFQVTAHESEGGRLSAAHRAALSHVQDVVRRRELLASPHVGEILQRAGCPLETYRHAMACVRHHARVVLHFHPDRIGNQSKTVAQALFEEGVYRNQFETGLSTGSLTAFPGGPRDTWERQLFGGAYHSEGATDSDRPKYGALEMVRHPDGPIPRFGSCYFVLRPHVSVRTSFTFAGSEDSRAAEQLGTIDRMDNVMAALFAEIEGGGVATPPWPPYRAPTLGVPNLTVAHLLDMLEALAQPRTDPAEQMPGRVLDTQIEAQVHGPIDLRQDVELFVADPAFATTDTGEVMRDISQRFQIPLRWHCGFRLPVGEVSDHFRGPAMPRLAQRIAGSDGILDAAAIGAAETSFRRNPGTWNDWDSRADVLEHLKQLWHVLVHFGRPIRQTSSSPSSSNV